MRIARTIVVVFLAVAIALLPASMNVATAAPMTNTVAAAAQAMPDCEHHRHQHPAPVKQTQKTVDHDGCITGCALCFGFVGADISTISYAITLGTSLVPVLAADDVPSLMGSPPFRPPRA